MHTPKNLKIIGVLLLTIGLVAAFYGPMEIYVFYFFSEGGRFYYDGFGIGSLWFATLIALNIGYYIIAALCLSVGVGHIKLRRWALTLTRLILWFWLGAGIILIGNAVLLIPSALRLDLARDIVFTRIAIIALVSLVTLVLLPILALRYYDSEKVRLVFEAHDPNQHWSEKYPFPLLALLLLFAVIITALHIAMFLQGMFPLFGQILLGRQAVPIISFCILLSGILIAGLARLKIWALWCSLVYVASLTISSALSFWGQSLYDVILLMNLPAYEIGLIDRMTLLHDFQLMGLFTVPLVIALGLVIYSKRYFVKDRMNEIEVNLGA